MEDGIPALRLTNAARDGRYRISKTILSDPDREVVLQEIAFEALQGAPGDYALHAIVAPHLVNAGANNTAWYGDYKGHGMLFAEGRGMALAIASSVQWTARSAGYVGFSDGWQTLSRGEGLRQEYVRADNGNVAISGTLDLAAEKGRALLAIGFGAQPEEAAFRSLISLQQGLETTLRRYCAGWREWQNSLVPLDEWRAKGELNRYRISTVVLATHRDAESGAIIASLSIPWGSSKGDDDLGGYHLVWPRDLVQIAGGLLAAGSADQAKAVLEYLVAVQEADGHWVQIRGWMAGHTGRVSSSTKRLFRSCFTICCCEPGRQASGYRPLWRHDRGCRRLYSPQRTGYAAGSLGGRCRLFAVYFRHRDRGAPCAADAMEAAGKTTMAHYMREVADGWNEQIDDWTYAVETVLSRKLGIEGYYIRIGSPLSRGVSDGRQYIPIRNRGDRDATLEADLLVSPDALALVRFGLRAADDPRIVNTITAIDAVLKRELPAGPYWYRYNDDGYGEHTDGQPFDGSGIGRLWPLLTGERAHYALAAGRFDEARRLLRTLEATASPGGLLPEQIWDSDDIPARQLFLGRPSGSAMPLAWAHAEHIKLLRSLRDKAVFDMPPQARNRYVVNKPPPAPVCLRLASKIDKLAFGRSLRLELLEQARVHWSTDGWATVADTDARPTGLGIYILDVPVQELKPDDIIRFTFFWTQRKQVGRDGLRSSNAARLILSVEPAARLAVQCFRYVLEMAHRGSLQLATCAPHGLAPVAAAFGEGAHAALHTCLASAQLHLSGNSPHPKCQPARSDGPPMHLRR